MALKRIFLIHGWSGQGSFWKPVSEQLRKEYDVFAPTLPGHEKEPSLSDLGIKDPYSLVEYIFNFYPKIFWQNITLCGYSMGGRIAILLANHIQKKIGINPSLIVMATGLGCIEEEEQFLLREKNKTRAHELQNNPDKFWNNWYAQEIFCGLTQAQRLQLLQNKGMHINKHLAESLLTLSGAEHEHLLPFLRKYGRFLYIAGSLDKKYSQLAQKIEKFCPEAVVHVIENCSHLVPVEKPQESIALIRSWVEN